MHGQNDTSPNTAIFGEKEKMLQNKPTLFDMHKRKTFLSLHLSGLAGLAIVLNYYPKSGLFRNLLVCVLCFAAAVCFLLLNYLEAEVIFFDNGVLAKGRFIPMNRIISLKFYEDYISPEFFQPHHGLTNVFYKFMKIRYFINDAEGSELYIKLGVADERQDKLVEEYSLWCYKHSLMCDIVDKGKVNY